MEKTTWLWDEDIAEYIGSDDPEKVRVGVLFLGHDPGNVNEFSVGGETLPHFGLPTLDKLARSKGGISEDVQQAFLEIVFRCNCFTPDLTDDNKIQFLVALVLRTGSPHAAMEAALYAKITKPIQASVTRLVRETGQQLLNAADTPDTPEAKKGAAWLLDWLLDGSKKVCAATLEEVGRWPDTPLHRSVIQAEWERLTDTEQQRLHEIQQAQKVRQTS